MLRYLLAMALLAGVPSTAMADPWKDESGHGRYGRGDHKVEWYDGRCKHERKWERGGGYKEEVKCRGPGRYAPRVYYERPTIYYAPPPAVVYPAPVPGITVVIPFD